MRHCDYKITYYQDGRPNEFRVSGLEVNEDLTQDQLLSSLKAQIKDLMKTAYSQKEHELHPIVNKLTESGLVFQPVKIQMIPSALTNTEVGKEIETQKTEYDGNVKLSDLKAHLDTATHPYKGLMQNLLLGEDLTQPTIHFLAEKYNPSGNVEDSTDSAFGVYIKGDNGIDTIKVYTGKNDGDLDVLNTDHEVTKVLAHELIHHKTSRALDSWYSADVAGFKKEHETVYKNIYDAYVKSNDKYFEKMFEELNRQGTTPVNFMKELYSYTFTDKKFAKKLNTISYTGDSSKTILEKLMDWLNGFLGINIKNGSILQEVLNKYDNLQYIKSSSFIETEEETKVEEKPNTSEEYSRIIDPFIYQQVAELPAYSPDQLPTANGKVWRNFFDNTQNDFLRYSKNYGEAVSIVDPNETIAGNYASLYRLNQNDIIRYHKMKKVNGEWVKDIDKFGYSPIIYNYFNKNLQQSMFVVATQNGPVHVPVENIYGYRKFYGNIRSTVQQIPASQLKEIIDNKVNIREYFDDKRINASKFDKLELYRNNHKFDLWKSKDGSAFFLNGFESQLYFRDFGPNDLIQIKKFKENTKDITEFGYYSVVRVLGSAVEVLDKKNQLRIVEKKSITGALLLQENHGDISQNYKEQFGDGKNKQLMDYFYDLSQQSKANFSNQLKLRELMKNNQTIPANLEYMLYKNKQQVFDESGDFVDFQNFTSVKDRYETEIFDEDGDQTYKLKKVGNAQRGDLILLKSDNPLYNHRSGIILDFDELTGTPVVGSKIKPKSVRTIKLKNGNYSTSTPGAFYKVETSLMEDIIGIGTNLIDNPDLDVYGNQDTVRKVNTLREDFVKSKEYATFETSDEALSYKRDKNLVNYELAVQYIMKDGKITFFPQNKEDIVSQRYVLNHSKTGELRSKHNPYNYVSGPSIDNNLAKDLFEQIAVGDKVTKRYKTASGNRYIDGVIVRKGDNSFTAETTWMNKNTKEIERGSFEYFVNKEAKTQKGLKDIISIGFSFKGRKDVKDIVNKLNKTALTGSASTSLKRGDVINLSKDFSSDDAKDYKKSAKTSEALLKGMVNNFKTLYNINTNLMTSEEIANMFDINPNAPLLYSQQRAFVRNNEIFINTDKASLAEPIHEMGHIVLQGLKATNNSLYQSILSKFASHPQYNNIAKYYPELDTDSVSEEVFVTTLGEMFNGTLQGQVTDKWNENNKSFFSRILTSIKNFFAEMFGIDSKRFFDIAPYEMMNMSFDEIHSMFGNSILNGDFATVVETNLKRQETLEDGSYLTNRDGGNSSLYMKLKDLEFSESEASNIWLKSKSPTFESWANGQILTAEDGEPQLFMRTDNDFEFAEASSVVDTSKLVFIKGNITQNEGIVKVLSSNQVKSIYNIGYSPRKIDNRTPLEIYAQSRDIKLQGTESEMQENVKELTEQYPQYEFEVKEGFGTSFISYYNTPTPEVKALRERLMKNNNLEVKC